MGNCYIAKLRAEAHATLQHSAIYYWRILLTDSWRVAQPDQPAAAPDGAHTQLGQVAKCFVVEMTSTGSGDGVNHDMDITTELNKYPDVLQWDKIRASSKQQ